MTNREVNSIYTHINSIESIKFKTSDYMTIVRTGYNLHRQEWERMAFDFNITYCNFNIGDVLYDLLGKDVCRY